MCTGPVHRIDSYTDLSVDVTLRSGVKKTHGTICMLASTGHGRGRIGLHVEDILVSLVLSIIISCTFRIVAHEENQYSYVYNILGQFFF